MMDQNRTPLIDAVRAFTKKNKGYFNIPAHRGERFADETLVNLLGADALRADLTETDGTDDLHAAEGAIYEAQLLASDLYGTDECRFLVNGSTCGVEAMILASISAGEKILVGRDAHKSVLMGLILSGAEPVWLDPVWDSHIGVFLGTDPDSVQKALSADAGIRAVCIVSPTYKGFASDVRAIAGICHGHGVPLLVDESHGGHYAFHPDLPESASLCGADLVTQSMHKTCGSLTQSSLLHRNGSLIENERLDAALKLVQSTSPSYLLMASLDGARRMLAVQGEALLEQAICLAEQAAEDLKDIPGVRVTGGRREEDRRLRHDPTRLVISAGEAGMSGYLLQSALFKKNITTELADASHVLAVITPGNTPEEVRRLTEGIREAVEERGTFRPILQENIIFSSKGREARCTPREAFFAGHEMVPLENAAGRIAAGSVSPYPPGIPLVCPGEVITGEICKMIAGLRDAGCVFHGLSDGCLSVVK